MLPWTQECIYSAHAQTPTSWHMHCCLSIKWVDQGVVYPFDYPVYSVISSQRLGPRCMSGNRGSTVYGMNRYAHFCLAYSFVNTHTCM